MEISGYSLNETLYSGPYSQIFSATRIHDDKPVLIKSLRALYPSDQELARLKREYNFLKLFNHPGIIKALALESASNGLALILEDAAGLPLSRLKVKNIGEWLAVGIAVGESLAEVHKQKIIHKDIKPDNLLRVKNGIKLIDFGIAIQLDSEATSALPPASLEGTLAYISPEATGRMDRPVDARSDIYSLGITFYEMLYGQVPFSGSDPLELVHAHLAGTIHYPVTRPDGEVVPPALPAILEKMLARSAEDRYQSVSGLLYDLRQIQELLEKGQGLQDFQPGRADAPERFTLPARLFGRQNEIEILQKALSQTIQGAGPVVLIGGHSGIGKTALIQELDLPLSQARGALIRGKYEELRRNIPYDGIARSLGQHFKNALSRSAKELEDQKEKIIAVTTPNTGLLTQLIPELEKIVGPQLTPPALPPVEAENRFNSTLKALFEELGRKSPVVLFLDDLQWADLSSFKFLASLFSGKRPERLLLVGAYRDNEIESTHPFHFLLERLSQQNVMQEKIRLAPLKLPDVYRYIATALACPDPDEALLLEWVRAGGKLPDKNIDSFALEQPELLPGNDLAAWLFQRSQGNPYLLASGLTELARQNQIYFDQKTLRWSYDIFTIKTMGRDVEPGTIVRNCLARLPEECRTVLKCAAAMGSTFRLDFLAGILNMPVIQTLSLLEKLIQEGLLFPVGSDYKFILDERTTHQAVRFRFAHDRIQQAAQELSQEHERELLHLKTGQYFLNQLSDEDQEEMVLEIAGHLNLGRNALSGARDRLALAELNLKAGLRALAASAPDAAARLFRIGYNLCQGQPLEKELLKELIKALTMLGETAEAEICLSALQTLTSNKKELLAIDELRVALLKGNAPVRALETGLMALQKAGIRLSSGHAGSLQAIRRAAKGYHNQKKFKDADEKHTDRLLAQKILLHMAMPARLLGSKYYPWIILKIMALADQIGFAPPAAFGLAALGELYAGSGGNSAIALGLGEKALQLATHLKAPEIRGQVHYLYAMALLPHKSHIKERDTILREGLLFSEQAGDQYFIARNALALGAHSLGILERKLSVQRALLEKQEPAIHHSGEQTQIYLFHLSMQFLFNLTGVSRNKSLLVGDHFNEKERLHDWEKHNFQRGLHQAYHFKAILASAFEDWEKALRYSQEAHGLESAVKGLPEIPGNRLRLAIAQAALGKKQAAASLKALRLYLEHHGLTDNINTGHLLALAQAEMNRLTNDVNGAIKAYDQSIALALEREFWFDAFLGMLRAASFYDDLGRKRFRIMYLKDALATARKYHARALAEDLEQKHPELARKTLSSDGPAAAPAFHTTTTATRSAESLDLLSVIKVSQTISGEIEFVALLRKLLQLICENTGAEKCLLVTPTENGPVIEASLDHGQENIEKRAASEQELILPAFNMAVNSGETVVVDDVRIDERTKSNPGAAAKRSLMVMPLLKQGQAAGYIYLENNRAAGAFTENRVQTLQILGSQMATSLENARLYSSLKESLEKEKEARRITSELHVASSKFVPREFLDLLGKDDLLQIRLGENAQKQMTVFFSDIRQFTTLSELMSPEDNFRFINAYLGKVGPIIREKQGFIDKYIGDAIMALFPGADQAVEAALEIQRRLDKYNESRRKASYPPVVTGIGINTGELMLGTIGEADRMEGTVISDAVNLASRLESLTRLYGAAIVISDATAGQLTQAFQTRILDLVVVKGKKQSIQLIEVLDSNRNKDQEMRLDTRALFGAARNNFLAADFKKARQFFSEILAVNPEDRASAYYLERIEKLEGQLLPLGWSGLNVLDSK